MQAQDIDFLRRQAEVCIALSRATFDLTLAGRLRAMAQEFRTKAAEWEDQIDGEFQPRSSADGSHTGNSKRN